MEYFQNTPHSAISTVAESVPVQNWNVIYPVLYINIAALFWINTITYHSPACHQLTIPQKVASVPTYNTPDSVPSTAFIVNIITRSVSAVFV